VLKLRVVLSPARDENGDVWKKLESFVMLTLLDFLCFDAIFRIEIKFIRSGVAVTESKFEMGYVSSVETVA
jgi:hypothetical protein